MKFCPECGTKLMTENAKFCHECGFKFNGEQNESKNNIQ